MEYKKENIKIGSLFFAIIVLLLGAACLLPYMASNYIRIIQIGTTVIFFAYMLLSSGKAMYAKEITYGLIGFYSLILLYWWVGYSDASIGNYFYQITFFIPIAATMYCAREMPHKLNVSIFIALLLMMSVHLIRDIAIWRMYGDLSFVELQELGSSVISTSFSTTSLIVLSVSLFVLLNSKSPIIRILSAGIVIISFYFIVFCGQRGSVVILMLFSVAFIIYERFYHKSGRNNASRLIALVGGFLIIAIFGDELLTFLIRLSPSERLTERFLDLQNTYDNGVSDDSFSGRLSLEIMSIQTWLSDVVSFFFGIGDHRNEMNTGLSGFVSTGIGGHSELIDSLARYGIVGLGIIVYLYKYIWKFTLSLFEDTKQKNQVRAILILSVLISLTKGLFFPEIGISLFLLLPLSSVLLNKTKM
jgi:hypothetical protein